VQAAQQRAIDAMVASAPSALVPDFAAAKRGDAAAQQRIVDYTARSCATAAPNPGPNKQSKRKAR